MGIPAGVTELTLGDPVAAERYLREAYAALRAMGERRYLIDISVQLAEALYAQDRLDEAQQMIDEARAGAMPDDRRGHLGSASHAPRPARGTPGCPPPGRQARSVARFLLLEASWADVFMAKGEVERLAGSRKNAEHSLRAALRIYEDMRAPALAAQARASLASLPADPGSARA